jgi:hypothetical protein
MGEFCAVASADVNGDRRVDVLDLQAIIAKALLPGDAGDRQGERVAGHSSVLDFQRALREVQLGRHEREIPVSMPSGPESCVFNYQTGRMADLVDREVESAASIVFPPLPTEPGEHVERCIIPVTMERYLFILTPNAPPSVA